MFQPHDMVAIPNRRVHRSEMIINQELLARLNEQIGNEFSAMLQYYAIAAHFERETLPMLAGHYHRQAEEEKGHALKFIAFILDVGGHVEIPAIPAPQAKFQFAEEAVRLALNHEERVTAQINQLVAMAKEGRDYTTDTFLQWFVQEQLEEVSSAQDLLSVVQRAGEGNLLRVEEYLAREDGKASGFRSSSSGKAD
jgi:bacterioferritin B